MVIRPDRKFREVDGAKNEFNFQHGCVSESCIFCISSGAFHRVHFIGCISSG
jgi:hypothetical protein